MVYAQSDRRVHADAIVLAIVFATQQMLFPIETRDKKGISVNYHVGDNLYFGFSMLILTIPVGRN